MHRPGGQDRGLVAPNTRYGGAYEVTSAPIAGLTGTYSGPNGHLFRAACARASCARARDMLNKHGKR